MFNVLFSGELVEMVMEFDSAQAAATPTPTGITILVVCGGILVALIGLWREHHITRRSQQNVEHEVVPSKPQESESLRDEIQRIGNTVNKLDDKMDEHSERLTRVETKLEHNSSTGHNYGRRSTDR